MRQYVKPFLLHCVEAHAGDLRGFHDSISGGDAEVIKATRRQFRIRRIGDDVGAPGSITKSDSNDHGLTVETITLGSLLDKFKIENVSLMKVDIEGAETLLFNSVDDDTLQRIDQIAVEFHDAYPDWSSLGVTTEWVNSLTTRLNKLGFRSSRIFPTNNLDNLYINTKRVCIPTIPKMYLFMKDIFPLIP